MQDRVTSDGQDEVMELPCFLTTVGTDVLGLHHGDDLLKLDKPMS